jgi:ADP-dependent NAD(P)H-hydrate dehydratase / NAD(P)H-hydrate epimerase
VTAFEPLYTADEMRAAEAGHDVAAMMERAGRAVADEVQKRYPDGPVTVVCGGGANGGDGRIAARLLEEAGRNVLVVDAKRDLALGRPRVIVDAIFGTGFSASPREHETELIRRMNRSRAPIVAVDIPSGVDASTGEVPGAAVEAERTVTFHARKVGHAVGPGRLRAGEIVVADIGIEGAETTHRLVTEEIRALVPRKQLGDNKYSAGAVLVVGGAPGMTGAVCLAAEAAFRADAGYVTVAAPRESLPVIEGRLLEPVKRPLDEVWDAVERAGSLALGPGLGREPGARELVRRLLEETDKPAVVDADGLFGLEPFERRAETVLTPHSGELGRLLGQESSWVDAHRLEAARTASDRFRCVVLLKGADTVIASPDGRVDVWCGSPPSLATAGTGDVLTGILAAFLAKRMDATLAAAAAAAVHGRAARLAPPVGMVAGDVIAALPRALAG